MSKMSDDTAKEQVKVQLDLAAKHISNALLWPQGMNIEDFHDLTNMQKLLRDIKKGVH